MDVKIIGVEKMLNRLMELNSDAEVALMEALTDEAEGIVADAKARVPVLTGRLRDSAVVVLGNRHVTVRFRAPYAAAVHERMEVGHATGGAKFLERAVDAASPGFAGRVAAKVKAGIE